MQFAMLDGIWTGTATLHGPAGARKLSHTERAGLHYVATVKDGVWHEEGTFVRPGAAPVQTIVLDLKRRGATDWPAGGAVKPQR